MSKNTRKLPPLEQLNAYLAVDRGAPSGLRWVKPRRGVPKDGRCGYCAPDGRWSIGLNRSLYRAHRVVWALEHGRDPWPLEVDHIDGDPSNNRIENLRLASREENMRNRSASRRSTSRYTGVSKCRSTGRWRACGTVDGKFRHLGRFDSEEEAARAFDRHAASHYGEFARLNFPDPS